MDDYINSEIAKIKAKLNELENLVNPPIEGRGNFCVKMNRESHFGDFMDWIKNYNYVFYAEIECRPIKFVSFKDGKLTAAFSSNIQLLSVNDWWKKFGYPNFIDKLLEKAQRLSKEERSNLIIMLNQS